MKNYRLGMVSILVNLVSAGFSRPCPTDMTFATIQSAMLRNKWRTLV